MAITYTLFGIAVTIPEERILWGKSVLGSRIDVTPKGRTAILTDVDFETFRRYVEPRIPATPYTWSIFTEQGPQGIAMLSIRNPGVRFAGTTTASNAYDVALGMVSYFLADDLNGGGSPLSQGTWTLEEAIVYVLSYSTGLQLALSGMEVGY